MEKVLRQDYISFDVSEGITIEDFNDKYNKLLKDVKDRYGYITDIKIHAVCGTYNYGEDYFEEIEIKFKRYETNEEFGKRKHWDEYRKNEQKRKEIELMKQYIQSHKDEALEIINNLNKN